MQLKCEASIRKSIFNVYAYDDSATVRFTQKRVNIQTEQIDTLKMYNNLPHFESAAFLGDL